jgi:hypothetical protein
VRNALAALPWVEARSIETNKPNNLDVTFGVNDKAKFNEEEMIQALPRRYREGLRVVKGPE